MASYDELSPGLAAKLQLFCDHANLNTRHPLDRKRWYDFLLAAYREHSILRPDDLEAWLSDRGWSSEDAHDLALEYDFATALLGRAQETSGQESRE
jgi:hypothetical protein